jgi:NitT/TauT family transport system permease protein
MNILAENLWLRRMLSLLALASIWEMLARYGIIDPFYSPPPTEVLRVILSLFTEGKIFSHLEATFTAALAGLLLGLAIGVFLGFAAALIPLVAEVLEPVMMLLNAIPRVIMAPLFVIWLGIDLASKVALSIVLVAVLIFFAVYSGIKDVNQLLVDRVRTLGGGRMILLREVYVPSVTAWVLGSRLSCCCLSARKRSRGDCCDGVIGAPALKRLRHRIAPDHIHGERFRSRNERSRSTIAGPAFLYARCAPARANSSLRPTVAFSISVGMAFAPPKTSA